MSFSYAAPARVVRSLLSAEGLFSGKPLRSAENGATLQFAVNRIQVSLSKPLILNALSQNYIIWHDC